MKNLNLIVKICAVVFTSLFAIAETGGIIAEENANLINQVLKEKTYEIIQNDNNENTDYFETNYDSIASLCIDTQAKAKEVEAEGAVLLKNKNNALPLEQGSSVSLFGYASVSPALGGSGSAASDNPMPALTLKDGLIDEGINVNEELYSFYVAGKNKYDSSGYKINDASWSEVLTKSSTFSLFGDAAIVVLKRSRGENSDPSLNDPNCDGEGGNYLALNSNEKSVLKGLGELKGTVFSKIIVLLNSPNALEANFIDNEEYKIDAALWIGTVGQTGMDAVAEILSGKINPSGGLSDTYYYYHKDNPAMANFGSMRYENYNYYKDQLPIESENSYTVMSYGSYVVYKEGIYVGYRYPETRYEDVVMHSDDVGIFNYSEVIAYPFGFGLSYTEFKYENFNVDYNASKDTYTINVKVTNVGDMEGKETVEIYLQKPYTEYDIENGIEKASVELVGFDKTPILQPQSSYVCSIEVEGSALASYDAYNKKTYVVSEGTYYFTASRDAHEAVNNILSAKGYNISDGMTSDGNETLVEKYYKGFDAVTYSVSKNGTKISNLFDEGDMNLYSNKGDNEVVYVSRNNWEGTLPLDVFDQVSLNLNQEMVDELNSLTNSSSIEKDDGKYPTYNADNGLTLVDLMTDENGEKIPYDAEIWDLLLDELSWEETCDLITIGMRKTGSVGSIAKPDTVEHNGPNGVTEVYSYGSRGLATLYGDPDSNYSPTYYPSIGILAATFNKELAKEVGVLYGEDALWAGYSGLYGIGLNLHRTAYDGRSFEYYSEDGYLSGIMSANLVQGLQSKGCNAYIKHIAVYEQQANRVGLTVWVNEQTLREIYLRPFQIATEVGKASNAMASYTRIGVTYCAMNSSLLEGFLKGECGLSGFVVSDMWINRYINEQLPLFLMNGCDLPDGDVNTYNLYSEYKEGYSEVAWKMREAAHRILYACVHSNAMNGLSSNTTIRYITPKWKIALTTAKITCGILFGISVSGLFALEILQTINNKKKIIKN